MNSHKMHSLQFAQDEKLLWTNMRKWSATGKTAPAYNSDWGGNQNWLKEWTFGKSRFFDLLTLWTWFKHHIRQGTAIGATRFTENFNCCRNRNEFQWWATWEWLSLDSSQFWAPFKGQWWKWAAVWETGIAYDFNWCGYANGLKGGASRKCIMLNSAKVRTRLKCQTRKCGAIRKTGIAQKLNRSRNTNRSKWWPAWSVWMTLQAKKSSAQYATDTGIQMLSSEVHPQNADPTIWGSRELDSKVKLERDRWSLKLNLNRISISRPIMTCELWSPDRIIQIHESLKSPRIAQGTFSIFLIPLNCCVVLWAVPQVAISFWISVWTRIFGVSIRLFRGLICPIRRRIAHLFVCAGSRWRDFDRRWNGMMGIWRMEYAFYVPSLEKGVCVDVSLSWLFDI
jgi:hypothetical protein